HACHEDAGGVEEHAAQPAALRLGQLHEAEAGPELADRAQEAAHAVGRVWKRLEGRILWFGGHGKVVGRFWQMTRGGGDLSARGGDFPAAAGDLSGAAGDLSG